MSGPMAPSEAEIDRMDLRLKNWAVWCRTGACDPTLWESDAAGRAGLTRDQVADAWAVHCMVMRLPIEMRIVIQVQYVSRPVEREAGQGESRVDEVNRRLRAAGVHRRMSGDQYRYVRGRAIGNMVNGEALLTGARERVESPRNWLGIRTSGAVQRA